MSNKVHDEEITTFVRNVLGCGCPNEVFNKIEVAEIDFGDEVSKATRIVIGDPLLIYILRDMPVETVADNISRLLTAGKHDRDSHSYNRFRLVLPETERKEQEESVVDLFTNLVAGDEKLHLHFVKISDLRWLN